MKQEYESGDNIIHNDINNVDKFKSIYNKLNEASIFYQIDNTIWFWTVK